MKRFFLLAAIVFLALPVSAQAQIVTRMFGWDKSADDTRDPAATNPVRYKFYSCADAALTSCSSADVGTALDYAKAIPNGITYYYVTAYWGGLVVDDIVQDIVESGRSNVLKVEARIPPGNPSNARIRVTSFGVSQSGQTIK